MVRDSRVCGSQKAFVGPLGLSEATIIVPVILLVGGVIPSNKQIREAFQPLGVLVCPRWRLKDGHISRHYSPGCLCPKSVFLFVGPPQHCADLCKCIECFWRWYNCVTWGSIICFSISDFMDGRSTIYQVYCTSGFSIRDCSTSPGLGYWGRTFSGLKVPGDATQRAFPNY